MKEVEEKKCEGQPSPNKEKNEVQSSPREEKGEVWPSLSEEKSKAQSSPSKENEVQSSPLQITSLTNDDEEAEMPDLSYFSSKA